VSSSERQQLRTRDCLEATLWGWQCCGRSEVRSSKQEFHGGTCRGPNQAASMRMQPCTARAPRNSPINVRSVSHLHSCWGVESMLYHFIQAQGEASVRVLSSQAAAQKWGRPLSWDKLLAHQTERNAQRIATSTCLSLMCSRATSDSRPVLRLRWAACLQAVPLLRVRVGVDVPAQPTSVPYRHSLQ